MPNQNITVFDQIVTVARDKQQKRRGARVVKNVPNPIIVLVAGDVEKEWLELLHERLKNRWSGQLEALQVCYCYVDKPYKGDAPILQAGLELPVGTSGAGALCTLPETLRTVNAMVSEMIDRVTQAPQIAMNAADIHVVMAPESRTAPLVSDLAAVFKGRMRDFGAFNCSCRLYLLLPMQYQDSGECERVCQVMDQLLDADAKPYDQLVLQPQTGAAPRLFSDPRLIDGAMLLDEMNDKFQKYDQHNERLELLVDLIENGWGNGYIQAAGVQEDSAGPEYWLAQAAAELCAQALAQRADMAGGAGLRQLEQALATAAQERLRGMEQALNTCCLFERGQTTRINSSTPVDEGESMVFGHALEYAYSAWLEGLPALKLPEGVAMTLDGIESDESLEHLTDGLLKWAKAQEDARSEPTVQHCKSLGEGSEPANVARFREYLYQVKYGPRRENDELLCCAALARLCAKECRERIRILRAEQQDFSDFAKQVEQAWTILRGQFNNGVPMPLTWIDEKPSPGALRRAGAEAVRTGDASGALSLIAGCVDLDGTNGGFGAPNPPLFCRIPLNIGLSMTTRNITNGVAAGHMLKFVAICEQHYDEPSVQRVHPLQKARQAIAALAAAPQNGGNTDGRLGNGQQR